MSERAHPERSEWLLAQASKLRALAAHLVSDPASADDVVQDTWVALLRSPPAADRPLDAWFARVARNFARRQRRAAGRRAERESRAPLPREAPTPDRILERLDSQRILLEELAALDEPLRTTVALRYLDELSGADIARLQGVPEGTVRWRLKRALALLRERLDARFDGRRSAWSALFLDWARPAPPLAPASGPAAVAIGQGVIVMSTMSKVGLALAASTLAGAAWWGLRGSPRPGEAPRGALVAEPAPGAARPAPAAIEALPELEARAPVIEERPHAASPAPPAADTLEQRIDARFVDALGAPWDGVHLSIVGEESPVAESGPDGRATLRLVWPAPAHTRHLDFVARRAGCAAVTLGATVHPGEPTHLGDVVLVAARTLRGRVLDEKGDPLSGAWVGLGREDLLDDDLEYLARQGTPAFDEGMRTTSDAHGLFELESVAPGTWRVWAKAEGSRYAWTEPFVVEERDVNALEIVVARLRPGDRLAGRVTDPEGRPVPEAGLVLHYSIENESGTSTSRAQADGSFDFVIRRDTPYTILASDPERRWAEVALERVEPGTHDLLLQLGLQRALEVRVHDPEGEPLSDCQATLARHEPEHQSDAHARALAPGRYRLFLPGYPVELVVAAPGFRPRTLGPFSAADAPEWLAVELERLPVIRGRVVADGRPLAGARVGLYPAVVGELSVNGFPCLMRPRSVFEARTDEQGRFALDCVEPGEHYVRAAAEGWTAADLGPVVPRRDGPELELALTHGGAIEGHVLLADGRNAEGSIVGLNRGDGHARTARAGPDGRFRFESLSPGMWQVRLCDSEIRPDATYSRDDDHSPAEAIEWDCEVVAGRTTYFDVLE